VEQDFGNPVAERDDQGTPLTGRAYMLSRYPCNLGYAAWGADSRWRRRDPAMSTTHSYDRESFLREFFPEGDERAEVEAGAQWLAN
jgi:hypothetical protein